MAVKMPSGKRFAVCFSFDVDITILWLGCFKFHTMNPLSRGEFGVEGLRRILDLLDKYEIKGTFYVPGHTALHHPSEIKQIVTRGHDIGSHGMYHQPKEVGRVRTIELILSVTEPKVWPGPSTGVRGRISGESGGGCPALMLSPVQDWDYGPPQGRWCAAGCSIPPKSCSCASVRVIGRPGWPDRWRCRRQWPRWGRPARRR